MSIVGEDTEAAVQEEIEVDENHRILVMLLVTMSCFALMTEY